MRCLECGSKAPEGWALCDTCSGKIYRLLGRGMKDVVGRLNKAAAMEKDTRVKNLILTKKWVDDHSGELLELVVHLAPRGSDGSITLQGDEVDSMVRDLLEDILEVWQDKHKHDPCTECHRQSEIRELLSEAPKPDVDLVEQIWKDWQCNVSAACWNNRNYSVLDILLANPKLSEAQAQELYDKLEWWRFK